MSHKLRSLVIIGAIFGYSLGYTPLYFFHLAALTWAFISCIALAAGKSIQIHQFRLLFPILVFFLYATFSVLWVHNLDVWLRYQFYLLCGLFALFATYQSSEDAQQLRRTFTLIGTLISLNLLAGLAESTTPFRLPMSPYSPYAGHFGIVIDNLVIDNASTPTGFNGNPNNFGFIAVLSLPFFIFSKFHTVKLVGFSLVTWLLIAIGSKGHFLAFILLLLCTPLFHKRRTRMFSLAIILAAFTIAFLFLLMTNEIGHNLSRILSSADEIMRGINLMQTGDDSANDSTGVRANLYSYALSIFLASPLIGVGFGGIESLLIERNFTIQSLHFFFLQILVDLGLLGFSLFFIPYVILILKLRSISNTSTDRFISYISKSLSLSLIVAVPASIAPSGIHYMLSFYVLVGLSLLTLKVEAQRITASDYR